MTTLAEAFQIALRHHQAGQLQQAEQIYRQILQADPRHVHAIHLLGVVAMQAGQPAAAIEWISRAIRIDGSNAAFHLSLGQAYYSGGKLHEAKTCFLRAKELDPNLPQIYYNLAVLHQVQGEWQSALDCCRRAMALKPDYDEAHNTLGDILRSRGDLAAAQQAYERALALNPGFFEPCLNLGSVLREQGHFGRAEECFRRAMQLRPNASEPYFFLGNLEVARRDWPRAAEAFEQALRLNPRQPDVEVRLGTALQAQGQWDAAIIHYQRAVQLDPRHVVAHYNWGTTLRQQDRKAEAIELFQKALQLQPDHVGALIHMGAIHQDRNEVQQALAYFDRVLQLEPDAAEAHFNRGLIFLRQGDLSAGWEEYAWRKHLPDFISAEFLEHPLWDGSPLPDKTLLVHIEQGLGDTLNFIRYIPWARQRCSRVVLQVQKPLVPLIKQSGYENVIGEGDPVPAFDVQAPLLNLPGLFGTTLENIPAEIPYLSVSPESISTWRERLGTIEGFRVGIVWKGRSTHVGDARRSIPLAEFGPLSRVAGVSLISLQKGEGVEQLGNVIFPVHQLEGDWDGAAGPFMDTAAVMRNLDLVITADTATAHLAGALGVDVWIALATMADWRWFLEGDKTPWYPSMRLFRQQRPGDWDELFKRIAAELERHMTRIKEARAGEGP